MSVVVCAPHMQGGQFVKGQTARCSSPTASTCSGLSRASSTSSVLSEVGVAVPVGRAGYPPQSGNLTPDMPARRPRLGATVCKPEVPAAPPRVATAMRSRPFVAEQSRSMSVMKSRPRACSDGCIVPPTHSEQLIRLPMLPGDILFVKGNGHLAEIGTTGGFMGHVLLVLAPPVPILMNSREACELQDIWPAENVQCIWRIPTVESTRSNIGLHQSQMLAHLESDTGRLILIGEIAGLDPSGALSSIESEVAEVWQSPKELRLRLCANKMSEVLREMLACQSSWSLTTAARAVFKSAGLAWSNDEMEFMAEVEESWETAPICTSVVISFWQRYLCKCARETGQSEMNAILKWMPLKADRGLPGELMATLQRCGWRSVNCSESIIASHSGLPGHLAGSVSAPSRPAITVQPRTPVTRLRSVDSAMILSPGSRFRTVMA